MFKILGVDHIGVAVPNLAEAGTFWSDILGLPHTKDETVEEQKVTTGFFPTPNGAEFELLEATSEDSPIAKYLEKNGGRCGIQHVAIRVDNLEQALADLKEKDYVRLLQPVIDGNEIMEMFHLKPSREVGVLKQYLKDAVLDNKVENEREPLMALLMEKAKSMKLI